MKSLKVNFGGLLIKSPYLLNFQRYPFWPYLVRYRGKYIAGLASLFLVDVINVILPLLIGRGIDALATRGLRRVIWCGILYFILMVIQAVGRYLWRLYLMGTSHAVARNLRIDLYQHLQRLPLSYYQHVRTGDLMSRATNDIESIRMAVGPGVLVTADAVMVFALIVPVMLSMSWKLSLFAFAFYPLVPWLTAKLGDKIDALFEAMQTKMSQMGAFIQESFASIRLIKSLVLESRVNEKFVELSRLYQIEGIRSSRYQAVFSPALGLLTNLGTFLILLMGGWDVLHGALTVGTFVAFQRFVVQLSWPMEAIGWAVTMNREGVAAQRRLNEIMNSPQVESTISQSAPRLAPRLAPHLLEIRHLKYRHSDQSRFELDLDGMVIHPGQKVGVVGPVGSGKTTFFQLLLRLYEPGPGHIYFNGTDITGIPLAELRRRIASVEQQIFLFSERISVNIRLGAGNVISDEEMIRAAKTACIWDEIQELETGFDASLGERGINLSGGQKQRIALARALVRQPQLLVLDDSFSAVDVAVENNIIENFFAEYPNLSVCFASHRLSVMPRMDEVWLIQNGALMDRGPHQELMHRNPLYQDLWERSERRLEAERFEAEVVEEGTT